VVAIADDGHVARAGEEVDDVRDDGLAVHLDQRLRHRVPGASEALAEPRHGNHDL